MDLFAVLVGVVGAFFGYLGFIYLWDWLEDRNADRRIEEWRREHEQWFQEDEQRRRDEA